MYSVLRRDVEPHLSGQGQFDATRSGASSALWIGAPRWIARQT